MLQITRIALYCRRPQPANNQALILYTPPVPAKSQMALRFPLVVEGHIVQELCAICFPDTATLICCFATWIIFEELISSSLIWAFA